MVTADIQSSLGSGEKRPRSPAFGDYLPLARVIAREQLTVRPGAPWSLVYQGALLGLWQATKTYDPAKGEWRSYAVHRIRHGVLDELRWSLGRKPDGHGLLLQCEDVLERACCDFAGFASVDRADELSAAEALVRRLPARWREVLLRRLRGEGLRLIGLDLGVTESRACQLQGQAVREVRRMVRAAC